MASPVEPLAPRPQAPLPAAGDEPCSGPGKLRPEPRRSAAGGGSTAGPGPAPEPPGGGRAERAAPPRPPPSPAGRASPAGGLGALSSSGGGGGGCFAARAPFALAFSSPGRSSTPSSFYFWPPPPPPPPSLLPSSSAFHLPVRLPGREGASAAATRGGGGDAGGGGGGGGQETAPLNVPPSSSHRGGGGSGGGGRRRLFLSPALQGLLLPARAGPRPPPPPPRFPLGPSVGRAGSHGFPGAGGGCPGPGPGPSPGGGGRTLRRPRGAGATLAAAFPLLFGSDMEDGPSNNASCFRRLTECFLSPSKCLAPHSPRWAAGWVRVPRAFGGRRASLAGLGAWPAPGHRGFPGSACVRGKGDPGERREPRVWEETCYPPWGPGAVSGHACPARLYTQTLRSGASLFSLEPLGWINALPSTRAFCP